MSTRKSVVVTCCFCEKAVESGNAFNVRRFDLSCLRNLSQYFIPYSNNVLRMFG